MTDSQRAGAAESLVVDESDKWTPEGVCERRLRLVSGNVGSRYRAGMCWHSDRDGRCFF